MFSSGKRFLALGVQRRLISTSSQSFTSLVPCCALTSCKLEHYAVENRKLRSICAQFPSSTHPRTGHDRSDASYYTSLPSQTIQRRAMLYTGNQIGAP